MSAAEIAVGVYRKLEPEDFRILQAIEIQMKRYEHVPEDTIHKPANLPPQEVACKLPNLRKKGLIRRWRGAYTGYRQVAIMKTDSLTEPMMDWVNQCREIGLEKLFSYKYDWLYKKVREINKDWWPHRFRAERASQLAVEKDFGVIELMKWFGWTSEPMATHYAKMSVKDLVEKMSRGEM